MVAARRAMTSWGGADGNFIGFELKSLQEPLESAKQYRMPVKAREILFKPRFHTGTPLSAAKRRSICDLNPVYRIFEIAILL